MLLLLTLACGERDTGVLPGECDTANDTGPFQVGLIDPECICEEPSAEIGTGIDAFTSHLDGDCLQMVHGPQGGWHLPGALRAENTRNVVEIVAYAEINGERITDELTYRVQLVDEVDETCAGSFPNMFLYLTSQFIDPELKPPELVSCQEVTITMCIDDTGGNATCDELRVMVAPDPRDIELGLVGECEACPVFDSQDTG